MNTRVTVTGRRSAFDMRLFAASGGSIEAAKIGHRVVRFDGQDRETPIYTRLDLPTAAQIDGPAILEQPDTTILIDPGLTGRVDDFGNVILRRSEQPK